MSGSQLALIKNLCLCYCDNKPGMTKRSSLRKLEFGAFAFRRNLGQNCQYCCTSTSYVSVKKIWRGFWIVDVLCSEHGNTYQDDIRLLDKIWKHCKSNWWASWWFTDIFLVQKYGRNQEMLRFGQVYARLNKLVSHFFSSHEKNTREDCLIALFA